MLMLQEMVCSNLELVDIDNIQYCIEIFEEEARTGNAYAIEGVKILHDMRTMVLRFKAPVPELVPAPTTPTTAATATGPVEQASMVHNRVYPVHGMLTPPDTTAKVADAAYTEPLPPTPNYILAANGTHVIPYQISEGDAIYQTLASWMEYDDMQLYNSFLI